MSRSVLSHYVQVTFLGRITQSTPKEICKEHEGLCMLKIKKKSAQRVIRKPVPSPRANRYGLQYQSNEWAKASSHRLCKVLVHLRSHSQHTSHSFSSSWLTVFCQQSPRVVLEQQHISNIRRREGTHTTGRCSTGDNHVMWTVASHPSECNKLREEKFVRLELQCSLVLKTVNASNMRSDVQKPKYKDQFMFKKAQNLCFTEPKNYFKTCKAACKMELFNAKQVRSERLDKVPAWSLGRLIQRKIVNCCRASCLRLRSLLKGDYYELHLEETSFS